MRDVAERLLNVATLGADIVERLISLDYLRFHGSAPSAMKPLSTVLIEPFAGGGAA